MAAVAPMLSSCLIEDPPPYPELQQTPPRLDLRRTVPLIDQIIVRNQGDRVPFNVPVASEDGGDDLYATLLLNYMGGEETAAPIVDTAQLKAGTLADTNRVIAIEWSIDAGVSRGCQRLTLFVTHFRNQNFGALPRFEVFDKADLAMAVWWANIDLDAGGAGMLTDCPAATEGGP